MVPGLRWFAAILTGDVCLFQLLSTCFMRWAYLRSNFCTFMWPVRKKIQKGYNVRACGCGKLMMVHMTAISAMSGRVLEDCFCMALRWLKSNWWLKSNLYLSLALVKFLAAPVPVLGTMGRKRRNWKRLRVPMSWNAVGTQPGCWADPSTVGSNLTGPSFIEYEVMYVRGFRFFSFDQIVSVLGKTFEPRLMRFMVN